MSMKADREKHKERKQKQPQESSFNEMAPLNIKSKYATI